MGSVEVSRQPGLQDVKSLATIPEDSTNALAEHVDRALREGRRVIVAKHGEGTFSLRRV